MYETITRGIRIAVEPDYQEDQSEPEEGRYVWSYTVRIANESGETVRLRTRTWRIVDAAGRARTIRGSGVGGEEPLILPGETFVYTSGAPLASPSGLMLGSYGMETASGEAFEADVPAFSLDSPHDLRWTH